jgi:hypothetical protein
MHSKPRTPFVNRYKMPTFGSTGTSAASLDLGDPSGTVNATLRVAAQIAVAPGATPGAEYLNQLAAATALHCPPPAERGPLIGVAPFQLYFELRNGYLCRMVGDAAPRLWKVEVCCGDGGVYDAMERTEAPYDIVRFMTTMSYVDSMPFGALFGVSKCGPCPPPFDATTESFVAFEAKVLGKIWAAVEKELGHSR